MLLSLLHLCDSLFPTGAFAHSDGLEWATSAGRVRGVGGLRDWLEVCLDEGFGRSDGPAVMIAWSAAAGGDWEALLAIDEEVVALRPSATIRAATRSTGLRLMKTWHAVHPDTRFERLLASGRDTRSDHLAGGVGGGQARFAPTFPIAFATVCVCAGIDRRDALAGFAYARLAATVSAAMRVMPLGQTEAHELLGRMLARVPSVIDAVIARNAPPESFAPAIDVAQMSQQYVHSRLFRS
jgi:urease accessory protein